MGSNPASDGNVILSIIMIILTGFAVALRFLVRWRSKMPFGADDAWVLASLIFFYSTCATDLWYVISLIQDPSFPAKKEEQIGKVGYASVLFPISAAATAKLSLLCLYRRIFFVTDFFQRCSCVAIIGVVIYWFVSVLGFLLECIPVQAVWDQTIHGRCVNIPTFFLALELYNCLLDLFILCLPIKEIRGLQMPKRHKIAVAMIFVLGGLVFIAGIVRMALIYRPGSSAVAMTENMVTTILENALAVICACLPTYGPILSAARSSWNSKGWYHSPGLSFKWKEVTSEAKINCDGPEFEGEPKHYNFFRMENGITFTKAHDSICQDQGRKEGLAMNTDEDLERV